jgi:hypothetical protein
MYSFFIDASLDAGLRALRARDGISASEAIRRAIAEYLEKRGINVAEPKPTRKRSKK